MGLRERLDRTPTPITGVPVVYAGGISPESFHFLKGELHHRLIDKVDLTTLESLPHDQLREELRLTLGNMLSGSEIPLNRTEREQMVDELIDEITGLGPLEPLLRDPSVSDILVNTYSTVYIERFGKLELTGVRFRDNKHLSQIINRIVAQVGRRVDDSSPMVDARLADGSRVNAIVPPLAIDGPVLSIRRFGGAPLRIEDLLRKSSIAPEMVAFLASAVKAKLNLLISGGTGTGKTTLLNAMSAFIPEGERIVTIEDAAELQLQQKHVVRLETRPANIEGKGEILARDLVRNSLRMRPDRIIVGEVRAGEVLDMLQAMNTGHEGSMTTVHANSPHDALSRIESMVGMSGVSLPETLVRQSIARAINIVVQLSRGTDGRRRVTSICELAGLDGAAIAVHEIFRFEQQGTLPEGEIRGVFRATGGRPHALERIERFGIDPAQVLRSVMAGS